MQSLSTNSSAPGVDTRHYHLQANNSSLWTIDNFVDEETADEFLEHGLALKLVEKPSLQIYGKIVHSQRGVGLFSDTVEGYAFSGQIQKSAPLTNTLRRLLELFNEIVQEKSEHKKGVVDASNGANAILVNRYGPSDYISAHSDKDAELVNGKVLILSVGATRTMIITDKKTDKEVVRVPLLHNSLLCMDGDFQQFYKHSIDPEPSLSENDAKDTIRVSFSARQHAIGKLKSKAKLINQTPVQDD